MEEGADVYRTSNVLVRRRFGLGGFDFVEQRCEYAPRFGQLVGAHEMHLRAAKHVQNQSFVRVRQLDVLTEKIRRLLTNAGAVARKPAKGTRRVTTPHTLAL